MAVEAQIPWVRYNAEDSNMWSRVELASALGRSILSNSCAATANPVAYLYSSLAPMLFSAAAADRR